MTDAENLGDAIERVHAIIHKRDEIHVIHTSELDRKDRELLLREHLLQEIIRERVLAG